MKIFLIEDEILALEELADTLQAYSGEHIVRCFESGEEAIVYAQKEAPDILISDIRMPGLNGLDTLQKLMQINPQLQAVMLSGYNDFEYARTALKYGAKEYLLKPVISKELFEVLDRVIQSVKMEEQKSQIAMDWSFNRGIRGIESHSKLSMEEQLAGGPWLMIGAVLENWRSESTWSTSGLSLQEMTTWLQVNDHPQAKCFEVDGHLRILLLPARTSDKDSNVRLRVHRIHEHMLASHPIMHTVYHVKMNQQSLESAYLYVLQLLEKQVRLGCSTFMFLDQPQSLTLVWDSARLIEKHIRASEYAKLNLELRRMLDNLKRTGISLKQASVFLSDFMYAIKFKLTQNQSDIDSITLDSVYEFLKTCNDYTMIQEWLLRKLAGMMKEDLLGGPSQPKQIIPSILDYIQQHYSETIQLQVFASKHHMSISHLSKLFKSETGANFSEYMLQTRMKKAQQLLDGGYTKISEISKLVGYEDPKFFSQIFKRWSGVTPQEYMKKDKRALVE